MNTPRHLYVTVLLLLVFLSPFHTANGQEGCPPPLMFYTVGGETRATVTSAAGVNLRAEPTTAAALVGNIANGTDIVLDADAEPVCADGYRWQRVTHAGQTGWIAEGRGGEDGYNLAPVVLRSGTQGRVSYTVDERVSGRTVRRVVAPDADSGAPGYDEIQFTHYRYADREFVDTPYYLRLYRTADLAESALHQQAVDAVRDTLYARVNQEPRTVDIPLLSPLDGVGAAYARVTTLDFDGGAGVRDLVAYQALTGAEMPLVYRFTGLTVDGEHLLSLTVPLSSVALDARTPEGLATQAEALPANAFEPNLELLDALVRSLRVNRAESVTDVAAEGTTEAAFGGIRFEISVEIARRIEFDLVPPSGDIARMSMAGAQPGRITATFVGYPNESTLRDPLLDIIDADSAPPNAVRFEQEFAALRDLLDARPALATAESPADDPLAQAFLSGGEQLFVQPAYIEFQGGRGVRYLTFFSQNYVSNVEPADLYYAFEGATDDGRYQIYAVFPLNGDYHLTTEPYDLAAVEGGVEGMRQRERDYIAALSRELDGLSGEAFRPSLATLDALIGSLRVG